MAREITKTNPIGVRFDKELLEAVSLVSLADSPQKALNLYEKSYIELVELKAKQFNDAEIIEEIIEEQVIETTPTDTPKKLTMKERIELEKLNLKK